MADVVDFPPVPANDSAPTVEQIDGEYLGSRALDEAEGDFAAARTRLRWALAFIDERELKNRAYRLIDQRRPPDRPGPEAA